MCSIRDQTSSNEHLRIGPSVGEEGLDFPACDLVIRFDPLQTMIGYVQSRGRARHQKSKFILMLNQDQPIEIQNYNVSKMLPVSLKLLLIRHCLFAAFHCLRTDT
jgi:ERCC4-related helicase